MCPDVVVAQIDPKKLSKKQSVNVSVSASGVIKQQLETRTRWYASAVDDQDNIAILSYLQLNVLYSLFLLLTYDFNLSN